VRITCYGAKLKSEPVPSTEIEELAWFTSKDMEKTSATGKLILADLKGKGLID